jgi:FHS family L-fucose permease-like MFS transporter
MTSGSMPRNHYMVAIVFLTYFVMSLLTNILGPLVPDIINSFKVSLSAAAFLPFCFFIAYGVMSIPAGFLVERFSEKPVMVVGVPGGHCRLAEFRLSSQLRGSRGLAICDGIGHGHAADRNQPFAAGRRGRRAFCIQFCILAQLVFGSASFLSPYMYSYLVLNLGNEHVGSWLLDCAGQAYTCGICLGPRCTGSLPCLRLAMVALLLLQSFSSRGTYLDEQAGSLKMYGSLFRNPMVWAFFFCVFAYVGSEQGTANWISKFLSQIPRLRSAYHRCHCSFLVLGSAHGWLLYRHVAAQDFR